MREDTRSVFIYPMFLFIALPTVSEYNDGKGLMISVTLHAQLPPIKPGNKWQSNAKLSMFTKTPLSSI